MLRIITLILLSYFIFQINARPFCTLKPPRNNAVNIGTNSNTNNPFVLADDEVVATAWYPGWKSADLPIDKISWSKYSALTYAFAVTTPDSSQLSLEASDEQNLPLFVKAAHDNGVLALVSVGGWTGSQYFSTAVATEQNRTLFVTAVTGLAQKYGLDGIDFDWEYPNKQGIGCNIISPNDSANFLAFLQLLRQDAIGKNLLITAAVGLAPFMGPDGTPMTDVSQFAKVFNYIAIMAYDIWGSWSATSGPNAPLNDSCAASPQGSASSAVQAWTRAGFPADQLVLGVAAYGHSFYVTSSNNSQTATPGLYSPFDKTMKPKGDAWDEAGEPGAVDQCGNPATGPSGVWNFWGLVQAGYLDESGKPKDTTAYTFDECSQTPFVYDGATKSLITYDDATSFAAKGSFINEQNLRGFAMWHSGGDYKDVLIDSIEDSIGVERVCVPDA